MRWEEKGRTISFQWGKYLDFIALSDIKIRDGRTWSKYRPNKSISRD